MAAKRDDEEKKATRMTRRKLLHGNRCPASALSRRPSGSCRAAHGAARRESRGGGVAALVGLLARDNLGRRRRRVFHNFIRGERWPDEAGTTMIVLSFCENQAKSRAVVLSCRGVVKYKIAQGHENGRRKHGSHCLHKQIGRSLAISEGVEKQRHGGISS